MFHAAFLYPSRADLAIAVLRLQALGVPIHGASDHLVSEAIYLEDPDGNGIEIYADRPEEAWEADASGVRMDTLRLDMDDLLAQAPERSKREFPTLGSLPRGADRNAMPDSLAAPAGIIVGHVHLRAVDLEDSTSFWTQTVGLTVTSRYSGVAAFMSVGGYHHHIGVNRFARWSPPEPGASGLSAMEISVDTSRVAAPPNAGHPDKPPTAPIHTPEGIELFVQLGRESVQR